MGEVYTTLNQPDYAAELAQLGLPGPRRCSPPAGGMGINFVKQYAQMGLKAEIPFYAPAFTIDHTILGPGRGGAGHRQLQLLEPGTPNPVNRKFVADFQQTYGRVPSLYAAQGYDAALFINHAVHAVGGDLRNKDKLRTALRQASFAIVVGLQAQPQPLSISRIFSTCS